MSSEILYFSPSTNVSLDSELSSINKVVSSLRVDLNTKITVCANWAELMTELHENDHSPLLIVFRLDYLKRENMALDEVLSMLSSLAKFVSSTKKINLAVVVDRAIDSDTLTKLRRNSVLGVIPGMRFFERENTILAYKTLISGEAHWPEICIKINRQIKRNSVTLSDRQYEIFTLVAKRGLSNKQIATELKIAESTVKNHVSDILKQFGLRSRTQLALANETDIIG
jgi:DNA-binding NarL/FixJ family response regulator